MTRVAVYDSTGVLVNGPGGVAILVYGPGTFDCESVSVLGQTYTGMVGVVGNEARQLLPLHPYYMAIMPYGLAFAVFLALITTRFRL